MVVTAYRCVLTPAPAAHPPLTCPPAPNRTATSIDGTSVSVVVRPPAKMGSSAISSFTVLASLAGADRSASGTSSTLVLTNITQVGIWTL